MRPIKKNFLPKELANFYKHLKTLPSEDENYPENTFEYLKNDETTLQAVQLSIAEEQGFVCCYCMRRLNDYEDSYKRKRVHIELEHYKPKSIFNGTVNASDKNRLLCDKEEKLREDLRIDYRNLLGACGTDGHCGNTKGDWELCYIPNPAITKAKDFVKIGYNLKGKIRSTSPNEEEKENINQELETRLNLNHQTLRNNRIAVWLGVRQRIKNHSKIKNLHQGGAKEIRLVKDLIIKYSERNIKNNKFFPYYDFVVYILKKEYKL